MPLQFDNNFRLIWIHDESGVSGIPAGFLRDNQYDGRSLQGSTSGQIDGGDGGHSHSLEDHTHTSETHVHYISATSVTASNTLSVTAALWYTNYQCPHATHSHTSSASAPASIDYASSGAGNTNSASGIYPAHVTAIIIKPTGTVSSIPSGVVAFTDSDSAPDNFEIASGINNYPDLSGLFVIGASSGSDAGQVNVASTGHTHTASSDHKHEEGAHSHSPVDCGYSYTTFDTYIGYSLPGYALSKHHTTALATTTSGDGYTTESGITTDSGGAEPAYTKLLGVQTTGSTTIPSGLIFGYVGLPENLDTDQWEICDGSGGTTDLSNTQIKITTNISDIGNTDDSKNLHTHSSSHGHVRPSGSHTHTVTVLHKRNQIGRDPSFPTDTSFRGGTAHTHTWTCTSMSGGAVIDADVTTSSGDHRGPWRSMIWVKSKEFTSASEYTSSGNLFIGGCEQVNVSGDLFIDGYGADNSSCDLFVWGINDQTASGDLYIIGSSESSTSGDLFIEGYIQEFDDIYLYTKGPDGTNSSSNLFIYGGNGLPLYIAGSSPEPSSGNIPLFTQGSEDENNSHELFIYGYESLAASGDLFIEGFDSKTTSVDLFIDSHVSTSSSIDLFINGRTLDYSDIPLYINGPTQNSSSVSLFVYGGNNLPLYVGGIADISSSGDLFVGGFDAETLSTDLFIEGSQEETKFCNLFIGGLDNLSSSGNLFVGGVGSGLEPLLPLFIYGYTSESGTIDLFIGGHSGSTSEIDLFIGGKNTIDTPSLPLFIAGYAYNNNSIDLFINSYSGSYDSTELFIAGQEIWSSSGDLYTGGHTGASSSGNLFIGGYHLTSGDTNLYVHGYSATTSSVDLFIHGCSSFSGSNDLYIGGYNIYSSSGDLFIEGLGTSSENDNLSLFIEGLGLVSVSGYVNLFVNGYEPLTPSVCPLPDPTASFQIPLSVIDVYQSRIDALINQVGKNVVLRFDPNITKCPNCGWDSIRSRSNGKYVIGGPRQFDYGTVCPYCNGDGILKENVELCIKCLIDWNPKETTNEEISVYDGSEIIKIKTLITNAKDLKRAKVALVDRQVANIVKYEAKLISGPYPLGIREDRYCVSFWRTI